VPLVDVRTTMLDPTLPLTAAEWEVCISYLAFISFHVSLSFKKNVSLSYRNFLH
jgi:hypothetical protein